jgi:hypothetical protein
MIGHGLVDVGRALDPSNDGLFTWWAPWRNMRQRNIGWRLDYVLASAPLAARAVSCPVLRELGTSDHAPVVATFADPPGRDGASSRSRTTPTIAAATRAPAAGRLAHTRGAGAAHGLRAAVRDGRLPAAAAPPTATDRRRCSRSLTTARAPRTSRRVPVRTAAARCTACWATRRCPRPAGTSLAWSSSTGAART